MTQESPSVFLDKINWVEGTNPLEACDYMLWCPGCETHHGLYTTHPNKYGALWVIHSWNPLTVSPSILCFHYANAEDRAADRNRITDCHCFVKNDTIEFLGDSTHKLAGRTVPMVPCRIRN